MNVEVDVCEDDVEDNGEDDELLIGKEATLYRAISARNNFLSADRANRCFAARGLAEGCRALRSLTGSS